jgi:hypothetical protein
VAALAAAAAAAAVDSAVAVVAVVAAVGAASPAGSPQLLDLVPDRSRRGRSGSLESYGMPLRDPCSL